MCTPLATVFVSPFVFFPQGACNGGNHSNCTEGYDGLLCSNCFNGGSFELNNQGPHRYYLGADSRCKTCSTPPIEKNELYVLWVLIIVVLIGSGLFFGVYVLITDTYHYNRLGAWRGRQKYGNLLLSYFTNPTTLQIAGHFSIIGTVATTHGASIDFPHATRVTLGQLSTIFDLNVVGLDSVACRFSGVNDWPMLPHFRVVMIGLAPVGLAVLLSLIYLASVIAMWRLWVLHVKYYDENDIRCCYIREREFPENIVVLIRRRLMTFFAFVMCFYYPGK